VFIVGERNRAFVVALVSSTTNFVFSELFTVCLADAYPADVAKRSKRCFLANVNSRSRSLYAIARPSVVCNVRAPYSGVSNFRQYFYGFRYLGHPLTSTENFTEIVPGKPLRRGS